MGGLLSWLFGHRNRPEDQTGARLQEPDAFVLQIDDNGRFWDPDVAERALAEITKASTETNSVVTLFIHGWHHNAQPGDRDVERFADALDQLKVTLVQDEPDGQNMFRASRLALTGDSRLRIIGLYVGWRGRALPGPLDYLTVWNRHNAAKRVGRGELRSFVEKLNTLYIDSNSSTSGRPQFMGLISSGHSFGGQVLFSATRDLIEAELELRKEGAEDDRSPLQGFGDLVVLLNPAMDAAQYDHIHSLARNLNHLYSQLPLLLVLSAPNDRARQYLFIGKQLLVLPFRMFSRSKEHSLKALGFQEQHTTHELAIAPDATGHFDPSTYVRDPQLVIDFDLTNVPSIGGVKLVPAAAHRAFNPMIVANVSLKVINGHSGFEALLYEFLTSYVALTQGKRLLLRHVDRA